MGIISWILVGAISGWLANIITGNKKRPGCFFNVVLGIIGAFVGGFLMKIMGKHGVTGFNLWSIIVATLGAAVLIWVVRSIKSD